MTSASHCPHWPGMESENQGGLEDGSPLRYSSIDRTIKIQKKYSCYMMILSGNVIFDCYKDTECFDFIHDSNLLRMIDHQNEFVRSTVAVYRQRQLLAMFSTLVLQGVHWLKELEWGNWGCWRNLSLPQHYRMKWIRILLVFRKGIGGCSGGVFPCIASFFSLILTHLMRALEDNLGDGLVNDWYG